MKNLVVIFAVLLSASSVFSADAIRLRTGRVFIATIIDTAGPTIQARVDGDLKIYAKSDVEKIVYNGTTIDYQPPVQSGTTTSFSSAPSQNQGNMSIGSDNAPQPGVTITSQSPTESGYNPSIESHPAPAPYEYPQENNHSDDQNRTDPMSQWQNDHDDYQNGVNSGKKMLGFGIGLLSASAVCLATGLSTVSDPSNEGLAFVSLEASMYTGIAGAVLTTIGGIRLNKNDKKLKALEMQRPTLGFYVAPNSVGICGTF